MAEPSTAPDSGSQPTSRPKGRRLAIVSIICGGLGVATCGVSAVLGVILGILALVKCGQGPAAERARTLAIIGIAVSAVMLSIGPAVGLPFLGMLVFFRDEIKAWVTDVGGVAVEEKQDDFFNEPTERPAPLPLRLCPAAHHRRCADAFSP